MKAVALLCLAGLLVAQTGNTFNAQLTTIKADAKTQVAGSGKAAATLNGSRLTVTGTFEGFNSRATIAQVHRSAAAEKPGPVVFDLLVLSNFTSGTIGGGFDLTHEQVQSLRKGLFYIQIHSEKAPGGNVRGWLMP